jgi:hypothetical protein
MQPYQLINLGCSGLRKYCFVWSTIESVMLKVRRRYKGGREDEGGDDN